METPESNARSFDVNLQKIKIPLASNSFGYSDVAKQVRSYSERHIKFTREGNHIRHAYFLMVSC